MFGSEFIPTYPGRAKQQLWDRLPGYYKFSRDRHHDMLINERKVTQADISCPSSGWCEITSRAPTDPTYQSERLQTSKFYITTKTGDLALEAEARVFRLKNGEWSLWNTDGHLTVTKKITDLTVERDYLGSFTKLRAVQLPWEDGNGVNKYLGLDFSREDTFWMLHHRIEQKEGQVNTVQGTTYYKIPEDRQEGWLEWLAEGAKVGFVGMKEYLWV